MFSRLVRSLGGVRVRVTLAALLAVAAALAVSAAAVEITLGNDRHRVLTTNAQAQAHAIGVLNNSFIPSRNPTHVFNIPASSCDNLESGLVQVVYGNKVVQSCSQLAHDRLPLWSKGEPLIQSIPDPSSPGTGHDVHLVAVPLTLKDRTHGTVDVVVSLDQYDSSLSSVRRLLEVGLPILLGVVGLICWFIVGRALRKIERLRKEVSEIATKPGEHRVADPLTNDEVGRLARTLNSMLDRMEQSSVRERRFVADASHELRSPIANIRTALEVALHRPAAADWERVASEVLAEDDRMGHLVEQLLILARSDEGHLIPTSEVCDLLDVATSVVESAGFLDASPPVILSGVHVPVQIPEAHLERVVLNLVENARRFAASRVEVTVSKEHHKARLAVRDDGPGVPAEERGRIFERFVRLDEARDREHGGFGLGLAIVADLCRAYGGDIEITDGSPGAVFAVEFPMAKRALRRPKEAAPVPGALQPVPR